MTENEKTEDAESVKAETSEMYFSRAISHDTCLL